MEIDNKTATFILSTIREEEVQTELLKRQTSTVLVIANAAGDAIDLWASDRPQTPQGMCRR